MGLKTSISLLLLIFLFCLFSSSDVHAKPSPGPASAPISSLAPSPSIANDGFSRYAQTQPFDPQDIDKIDAAPMLKSICADTDHPPECIATLIPYVREDKNFEPTSVLEAAVQATTDQAQEGLALAKKIHGDPSSASQPILKSCLDACIISYSSIIHSNQKILDAIAAADIYTLNTELGANIDNVDACEDAFDAAEIESPLAHVDDVLGKMVSNNLAIGIDLIKF
ncbi:hypothetical protein SLE2022_242190 [Rubroshorea leprosula]